MFVGRREVYRRPGGPGGFYRVGQEPHLDYGKGEGFGSPGAGSALAFNQEFHQADKGLGGWH
eukprot:3028549-Lingulodinium_polyedra.AAC.1